MRGRKFPVTFNISSSQKKSADAYEKAFNNTMWINLYFATGNYNAYNEVLIEHFTWMKHDVILFINLNSNRHGVTAWTL